MVNPRLAFALFSAEAPQYRIAQAAGMSESRLSRIARGRIEPTEDERRRIALALGKPVDELFEGARTAA